MLFDLSFNLTCYNHQTLKRHENHCGPRQLKEEEDARPHARLGLVDVGIGQGRARHPRRKEVESFIPSRDLPSEAATDRRRRRGRPTNITG